jgi:hypothetical protein
MIINIVKYLKIWHNKIFSIEQIKNILPFCIEKAFDRYIKKTDFIVLFNNLRNYHKYIKLYFLKKYCNKGVLFDIGSGQLKNIRLWKQLKLNKIISMELLRENYVFSKNTITKKSSDFLDIEPSETLYNEGLLRLSNDTYAKEHITFIRATGEHSWVNGEAGLNTISKKQIMEVLDYKADSITFEFTIHYMIYNSDILMKNLKLISKKGTTIIIHCLNGSLIKKLLLDTNKYNVYKDKDVVFSIEKKYKESDSLKEISVYFKNVQGLDNTINEYLVINNSIIKLFNEYGFRLVEYVSFIEHYDNKFHLESYELEITKLYITYIFSMD